MITFIATHPYTSTVAALRGPILGPLAPPTHAIAYDELLASRRLASGVYVFTDHERLHPAELRLAARFFRVMAAAPGLRVLNDPARVKVRYALLRALAEAGINDFDCFPADGLPRPRRFPFSDARHIAVSVGVVPAEIKRFREANLVSQRSPLITLTPAKNIANSNNAHRVCIKPFQID